MNKILVVCGPTATGKTELAIKLAEKFNGELISADSRQVYKGMDIITGKDHPQGTKIHLIDVAKPNEDFSVAHYVRLAWKMIRQVWKAGKLPILVGGTGFYIKAVINGVDTIGIPPNEKVRQGMKNWLVKELMDYLANLDSVKVAALNKSDRNNPRRLIRAIEVALWKKENKSVLDKKTPSFSVLYIGLKADYKTLYRRIDQRVTERLQTGAEQEIKELLKKGYSWENSALGVTTGYREWQPYFQNKESKIKNQEMREEVISKWQFTEHGYARRQMTWFKKNKKIHWFDISSQNWQNKIEGLVGDWYDAKN
jgi:tRNA dimethylallyltransferase